ncbi:unnamed protein product, partial [Didymodactylos carnosus]
VVINAPIDDVFHKLTSIDYLERVIYLSDLASDFKVIAKENDYVFNYQFCENVSSFFGLIKNKITIIVKQTADPQAKTLLYESNVNNGMVTTVKRRSFTALNEQKTQVSETVDGECSFIYQPLVKTKGHQAHCEHMEKYHTLFDSITEEKNNI